MITSNDFDYIETKMIKQGTKVLKSPLKDLAEWINKEYYVNVINIHYDYIEDNRPRLGIIFEYDTDERKFHDKDYNYDPKKQKAILNKFNEILLLKDGNNESKFITKWFKKKTFVNYNTKNLLVIFNSFDHIAKEEANHSIPLEMIQELKTLLNNKDLWEIQKFFSSTTFFFYTDEQVKAYNNNGYINTLSEAYFNLLKQYDEFDYIKKESFRINLDSKENFDKNYDSNWFNYYR
jgi:hypothetical protein